MVRSRRRTPASKASLPRRRRPQRGAAPVDHRDPAGVGDFASGAVDKLGNDDIFIVLFEYDPASVDTPLFKSAGLPRTLTADDFSPNVMQRAIRGQAGVQKFFHDQGRAFCLYVVIGSFVRRRDP